MITMLTGNLQLCIKEFQNAQKVWFQVISLKIRNENNKILIIKLTIST